MRLANQRYTSKVIRKLAEDDTKVALSRAQQEKQQASRITLTKQKPTPVILDPDKRIQGQSQFS